MIVVLKPLICKAMESDLLKMHIITKEKDRYNNEGYQGKGRHKYNSNSGDDCEIDLSALTKKECVQFSELLETCNVHGSRVIAADVRKFLKASKEGIEGLRSRNVRQAAWMLEHYFARLPHHIIFSKDRYGGESHSGYYVSDVNFEPEKPGGRNEYYQPAYCTISMIHIEDDDRRFSSIRMYSGDCVQMTCLEILANQGFVPESEELMEKLRSETERFYIEKKRIGKQFIAHGIGVCDLDNALRGISRDDDDKYYRWSSKNRQLDHYGETRVVVDVLQEKDSEKSSHRRGSAESFDPYRWHNWNMRFHAPSEDELIRHLEADEDTVEPVDIDIPVHPLIPCFDLIRHDRLRIHINCLERYVYDKSCAENLILPERDWKMINLLVDCSSNKFADIVAGKGRSMNLLAVGPPGCLHADTPIYDPVDNTTATVKNRWIQGKSFHVFSLNHKTGKIVIAEADRPYKYEPSEMLKITFSSGNEITVTPGHKIWNGSSYVKASHLVVNEFCDSLPGISHELLQTALPALSSFCVLQKEVLSDNHLLLAFDESHLQSILEFDLLIQKQDARHLTKTIQDFQDDYQIVFYSCGEQLQLVKDNVLSFSPSQDDVQQPDLPNLHVDALGNKCNDNFYDSHLSSMGYSHGIELLLENEFERLHKEERDGELCDLFSINYKPFLNNQHEDKFSLLLLSLLDISTVSDNLYFSVISSSTYSILGGVEVHDQQQFEKHCTSSQSDFGSFLFLQVDKPFHQMEVFCDSPFETPSSVMWQEDYIVSVSEAGSSPYFDFHVPEYENYWACGLIHHNTGKTATAEIFAEFKKRPLYTVQCFQLGLNANDVEHNLRIIMNRANRWNAILLLDEADVYIRKRSTDLEQNAIVGAFLRVLEYASCILFMTTNLEDSVDDAITSRCIAKLNYGPPSKDDQAKIWRILADLNDLKITDKEISKIVNKNPHLTGRDVKNLLKLSSFVAASTGKPLDAETVEYALMFKPTEDYNK